MGYHYDLDRTRIEQTPGDVLRGGSWNNNQNHARAAYRLNYDPDERNYGLGFRVVRVGAVSSHHLNR